MPKKHIISSNSSFVSIREGSLKILLPSTDGQEKDETPVLDIDAVSTIARIVRTIKARIEAEEGAGKASGGNRPGPAVTGADCSKDTTGEGTENS